MNDVLDARNKKYRIKGDVETALKVLKSNCINNQKEEKSDFTGLYKKIISELDSSKNDNEKVKDIKHILDTSREFKAINKRFCRKYVFSYSLSKKRYNEILRKSDEFFCFLHSLSETGKTKLENSSIYMTSLYLTYLGLKPASLLSKELASVLKSTPNSPFATYEQVDSTFNETQALFYEPQKLLKVTQQNKDVFGNIKNESELKEDLAKNQICISYRDNTKNNNKKYYYEQMRTGIILGIPKGEVIKFASFEKFIYQYEEYLYKNERCYYDYEDEYFDSENEPKNIREYDEYKTKNLRKLNLYTPQSESKSDIIDILAGRVLVDFSYQYYQSDVKFYTYGFNKFINNNYAASLRKIFTDARYFENLRNLGL